MDPLGGSYLIEAMTDRLETEARALLAEIDRIGGPEKAIETGYFQKAIHRSACEHQRRVEAGLDVVVGVNQFRPDGEAEIPFRTLRVDPDVGRRRAERLAALRLRRDAAPWRRALDGLRTAACGDGDLMAPILECVRALATVGEITACLRGVFGEYREVKIF